MSINPGEDDEPKTGFSTSTAYSPLANYHFLVLIFGSVGFGFWLAIPHPAVSVLYRSWFLTAFNNFYSGIIYTAVGIIFTAFGLFKVGVQKSLIGPTRTRILYIVVGLLLLIGGLTRLLLH